MIFDRVLTWISANRRTVDYVEASIDEGGADDEQEVEQAIREATAFHQHMREGVPWH